MRNSIIVFCLILFSSCADTKDNSGHASKDSSKKTSKIENNLINAANINSLLIGIWAESEKENALFRLDGKYLYYTEDQKSPIAYSINGDSLIIYGDPKTRCKILKISKDTLWFTDEYNDDTTKLYNRRK